MMESSGGEAFVNKSFSPVPPLQKTLGHGEGDIRVLLRSTPISQTPNRRSINLDPPKNFPKFFGRGAGEPFCKKVPPLLFFPFASNIYILPFFIGYIYKWS
jgi:hypothetical protein